MIKYYLLLRGKMNTLTGQNKMNKILIKQYCLPQKQYSDGIHSTERTKIYYISDIHLLHHLKGGDLYLTQKNISLTTKIKSQINKIVKEIFTPELIKECPSKYYSHLILFAGDISSNTKITEYFYKQFCLRYIYYSDYLQWKQDHQLLINFNAKQYWLHKYKKLQDLYNKKVFEIKKWLNYSKRILFFSKEKLKKYAKTDLPDFIEAKLSQIATLSSQLKEHKNYKEYCFKACHISLAFKAPKQLPIIAILGNHELQDFSSVNDALKHYYDFFTRQKMIFLNNNFCCVDTRKLIIVGGTAFAKFNERFNVTTLINTTPSMTRKNEISESEAFYSAYKEACVLSEKQKFPVIVLTHYPTRDWLGNEKPKRNCTYFNGHTHQNSSVNNENYTLYADNQIGYRNKNIHFKSCYLGVCYNPFIDYKDGYFQISVEQYKQFMEYSNEPIQGTGFIDFQINTYKANFYMIKQKGFYAFFVINPQTGTKICVGGKVKFVSNNQNIKYFYKAFLPMLTKYLKILAPYRSVQEKISEEVKSLGFDGNIHGCIIDIDFYHHIMLSPLDGTITLYYAPFNGAVQKFDSMEQLINNMLQESPHSLQQLKNPSQYLHNKIEEMQYNNCLITQEKKLMNETSHKMVIVDRSNSLYKLSGEMNQYQRLFTKNILREWNDEWAKSFNESPKKIASTNNYLLS